MSSRALRKIRGDNELAQIKNIMLTRNDSDSESDDQPMKPKKSLNVFDLLNAEDSPDDKIEETSDDKVVSVTVNKPKQKNKKKKKKAQNIKNETNVAHDEDIDKIISELNINYTTNITHTASSSNESYANNSVLTVKRKNLNADNELRRIFGSNVVNNEARSRTPQFRRRVCLLTTPKSTWPPMTKCGIQMVTDRTLSGVTYFKYTHSKTNYRNLQQMFWKASQSTNPEAVKRILEIHPYHVDTLLHLSEVCRIREDTQTASDLLERALYCLEIAFHPSFNITSMSCRMDYNQSENRALFIAIFRQILYVSLKSCWQTAFELTKLLYNLSPDQDPLACLLFIDIFALKVEDYNFVLSLVNECNHSKKVTMLPNFAYSQAVAQFYKEIVNNSNHDRSSELLQDAILKFPMVAKFICEKCNFTIESNQLFIMNADILKSHTKSLTQQCVMYVERASDLWKDPEIIPWCKENIDAVNTNFSSMSEFDQSKYLRETVYLSPPLNVMRHIYISDIASVSSLLPGIIFDTSQDPHDPLPPPNSVSDYYRDGVRTYTGNPVLAFFDSLMPNYSQSLNQFEDHLQERQGLELAGFLQPTDREIDENGWGNQLHNIPGVFGNQVRNMINNLPMLYNAEEHEMPQVIDEADNNSNDGEHAVVEDDLD